ncbi:peptidoglycan DD-metalloendopeptidase family protein [Erythrobacter aquimaris]|uniref:Peptidoglycan DD-metalloendopeptidase family protein n=1 Tax=Qipengyuania aquimaris TaxID=255984 RepID=A0A6I4TLU4_9SPHN|nr:peptidoglycan DD-metalloendopeptidase family protein [Qipengyuania aquimaris]MXO96965.1 peptidoglycan DD-metalloendopeptidase family protein [Qipengyuania aquimaris]
MIRAAAISTALLIALVLALPGTASPGGASAAAALSASGAREALEAARQQQRNARARAERLEQRASRLQESAGKAQSEAAALAARVQQSEAAIAASEAELALLNIQKQNLDRQLSRKREPLMRLTAALQTMARRPLALAALQPGSLEDLVHTRAALSAAIPIVKERTSGLRSELDLARDVETRQLQTLESLRAAESSLDSRRRNMLALAEKERLQAQRAAGGASREAERALFLAEEARDLDSLVGDLEAAAAMRSRLAVLPGPVLRPGSAPASSSSPIAADIPRPSPSSTAAPDRYILPVGGRVVTGFGDPDASGERSSGLVMTARPRAQVVAPGEGRVVFAGPYRGFGAIAIIEHANGWTSLITGMSLVSVAVGQPVTAGSPLGQAGPAGSQVALEVRRDGEPVNPLDLLS